MSTHRRYDVYDDTGRSSRSPRSRSDARTRSENRRNSRAVARRPNRERDPMTSLFDQFDRDVAAFHDSLFSSFPSMAGAFDGTPEGGGTSTYMYEAHTSRMGPDGRVTTETIRTKPGRDGRPETRRVFRDADGHETMTTSRDPPPNPFEDFGWPFRGGGGGFFSDFSPLLGPTQPAPPAEVHEITDEEDRRRHRRSRHRSESRSRRQRVVVEEPDDNYDVSQSTRDEREERRRRPTGRKTFFERARDWRDNRA